MPYLVETPEHIVNSGDFKLGKKLKSHDDRNVQLKDFLAKTEVEVPVETTRHVDVPMAFKMFGNDEYGDCAFAGQGNADVAWTSLSGKSQEITDAQILGEYSRVTGFVPSQPDTDQGTNLKDALNNWRQHGIAGRHKIKLYAELDYKDQALVQRAIYEFDGLYIGVQLPLSAQGQKVWDIAGGQKGDPGTWGGHCVFIVDYTTQGPVVVTWGMTLQMTWGFWMKYVDEAYALEATDDMRVGTKKTYEGFNQADLNAAVAAVTGQSIEHEVAHAASS